mgnify:CR=1 FL=1
MSSGESSETFPTLYASFSYPSYSSSYNLVSTEFPLLSESSSSLSLSSSEDLFENIQYNRELCGQILEEMIKQYGEISLLKGLWDNEVDSIMLNDLQTMVQSFGIKMWKLHTEYQERLVEEVLLLIWF